MLLTTYDKIIDLFHDNHGYMSFDQLKEKGVTIAQIQELADREILDKFARGWYWCNKCGYERPVDRKYIEIGKVNEKAVICMDSAGYLQKLLKKEPETISVATERTDRKKMEFAFPVNRYYFQNTGIEDEIERVSTEFGSYRVYSVDRTVCDCIRMKNRLGEGVLEEIEESYKKRDPDINQLLAYGRGLRALKCIKERNL
ncbi:MAG TPA: hypothetical protein H9909_00570 [Candidatus Mediterraneibacter norfolkensis]|nr:hypothetical protein [Candidatus Mediterraneibacter norfolkensis]